SLPDRSLAVGEGGALAGVVVELVAPPEGPDPAAAARIDQRGCEYTPPVLAMRAGGTLAVHNSDDTIHTVRATKGDQTVFNYAQPLQGMTTQKPMPGDEGEVELRCDVHPWMHAAIRLVGNPHFAVTGADGRYALAGLP